MKASNKGGGGVMTSPFQVPKENLIGSGPEGQIFGIVSNLPEHVESVPAAGSQERLWNEHADVRSRGM